MKREILFRAKRLDGCGWDESCSILFGADDSVYLLKESPSTDYDLDNAFAEVDPDTVCQFTGLTDKHGKKIFEGDILRVVTNYYGNRKEHEIVVVFEEIENDSFGEPYTTGYCVIGSEWEVIGNIFDNPELLEVTP